MNSTKDKIPPQSFSEGAKWLLQYQPWFHWSQWNPTSEEYNGEGQYFNIPVVLTTRDISVYQVLT